MDKKLYDEISKAISSGKFDEALIADIPKECIDNFYSETSDIIEDGREYDSEDIEEMIISDEGTLLTQVCCYEGIIMPGNDEKLLDLARELLKKGANPNAKDIFGRPLIVKAIRRGLSYMIKFLIIEAKVDLNICYNGESLLYFALIKSYDPDTLELMVENGVDINKPSDRNGSTILMSAVDHSGEEYIEFLLELGADINATDDVGDKAIHYVDGNPEAAKLLIAAGADPEAVGHEGKRPIHHACRRGDLSYFKFLVEDLRVDIFAKTDDGDDAMHLASLIENKKHKHKILNILARAM